MEQGLFTIQQDGTIHLEYSTYLENIFETQAISGQNGTDLLFKKSDLQMDRIEQAKHAILASVGEDSFNFDFNLHLLITEYSKHFSNKDKDKQKHLELAWNPIIKDDTVIKLMVTVRDVTQLRHLQLKSEQQKRKLNIINQLLQVDSLKFQNFLKQSQFFISQNQKLLATANQDSSTETLASLFVNMHTLKGNARTYGFDYLSSSVHQAESSYSDLQKKNDLEWDIKILLSELERVKSILGEYANISQSIARHSVKNDSDSASGFWVNSTLINKINKLEYKHSAKPTANVLEQLQAKPLSDLINNILCSIPSIAKQLGKNEPITDLKVANSFIVKPGIELIENVFTHLVRNSIDHGIETKEQRNKAGKPEAGKIQIYTTSDDNFLKIQLLDDGQGLNINYLFEKGLQKRLWDRNTAPQIEQVAQLIFESGMSTKESIDEISGRGIGMAAVKRFLTDCGGDINLSFLKSDNKQSGFSPFETIVSIPKNLVIE